MTLHGESYRVTCPYCVVGHVDVLAERYESGGEIKVEVKGMDEPRLCGTCKRFFKLRARTKLVGVPLEQGAPQLAQRA